MSTVLAVMFVIVGVLIIGLLVAVTRLLMLGSWTGRTCARCHRPIRAKQLRIVAPVPPEDGASVPPYWHSACLDTFRAELKAELAERADD
jgi:hypothetical protein